MTKYQEKTFKDYLRDIEDLNRDFQSCSSTPTKPFNMANEIYKDLKQIRISFFNWFKKQVSK